MPTASGLSRRRLLSSTAMLLAASPVRAGTSPGPWDQAANQWQFFTPEEAELVGAIFDRLIPADEMSVGGREAGCVVYTDRQLAGPFGRADRLYMRPPFQQGTPEQGGQSPLTPADLYRSGLAALEAHCRSISLGKGFGELGAAEQDRILKALEKGGIALDGVDAQSFFEQMRQNAMEGFFADPIYGGNRDMVGWRLIGFPGARYDYRDHLAAFDAPYDRPPVGLTGGPEWREGS